MSVELKSPDKFASIKLRDLAAWLPLAAGAISRSHLGGYLTSLNFGCPISVYPPQGSLTPVPLILLPPDQARRADCVLRYRHGKP